MLLLCLLILAAAVAAYRYLNWRDRSLQTSSSASAFKAVAIVCDDAIACPAARALDGKRFLGAEAPKLPLPDCTTDVCTCTFHHHPDRRKGPRRAEETGVFAPQFEGEDELQTCPGRRSSDIDETDAADEPADGMIDPDSTYYDFIAQHDGKS